MPWGGGLALGAAAPPAALLLAALCSPPSSAQSPDTPWGQLWHTAVPQPYALRVGWAAWAASKQAPGKPGFLARVEHHGFVVGALFWGKHSLI